MKKLPLLFIGLLFWTGNSFGQNLSEGFENEFLVPPDGWTVYYENPSPDPGNLVTHTNYKSYSEERSFRFSSSIKAPPYDQYLVTPQLDVTSGDQTISFYYSRHVSGVNEIFKVGWSSTGNAITDFTWSTDITVSSNGFKKYEKNDLQIGTKYVAIRYVTEWGKYLYIDEVEGPALYVSNVPPNCSVISSPANAALNVPITTSLNWASGGGAPTGYKLYFGTDGEGTSTPTNLQDGMEQTSPYTQGPLLNYGTTYYWQVVPFNNGGSATECPIWSFTTKADPTILNFPHTEDFEGMWSGTPEAPEGWTIINPDNDNYLWKRLLRYYESHSGVYTVNGMGNTNDYLITPAIDLTGTKTKIKWWDKVGSEEYMNSYKILVSTTNADIASFTIDLGTFNCANEEWTEHVLDLRAYTNQIIYVAFYQFASAAPNWYFQIDDVTIEEISDNPIFVISPESKIFGTVDAGGTSPAQTFTITNDGLGPLEITGIAFSGANVDQFVLSTATYPINLNYGESTTVDVTFKPTSGGEKTAFLVISDNQGDHKVALTGNPQGSICSDPISLLFPAVNITGNTGDYGNDYSSEDIDNYSEYLDGYEVVYQFTLDEGYMIEGNIVSSSYNMGVFVMNDCPDPVYKPEAVYYGSGSYFSFMNWWEQEPGTYFLIISSQPETGNDQSIDYNIDLWLEYVGLKESTFTGTGNWSDPDNWTNNLLPGSITDVTINGNVTVDGYYECNSLTIAPAGAVTIPEGENEYLEVKGELLIQSDATGTGSFIDFGGYSIWGESTIERYLTKYNNSGDRMFHFISSPVAEQPIRPEFVSDASIIPGGTDFYSFDEPSNYWINTRATGNVWNDDFEDNFLVGKGYLVAFPDNVTKNFTGDLNSYPSETPLVLTCTNNATPGGNGWNLLGNPFPSAIDWSAVTLGDGMDNALYYYDNTAQNYRSYIKLSGESGSLGSGQRWIPAMQGFMVHAKATGTKTVTLSNAARTHTGQDVFYKSTNASPGSLSLKVTANGYEDEAFIHFNQSATSAFDGSFDAYKLRSYSDKVPMIFTKGSDDSELAINGLPELDASTVIPVYFEAATEGEHTLTANLDGLPNAIVYLIDIQLNKTQNLNENPVYSFTASNGDNAGRYKLTFSSVGIDKPEAINGAEVYAFGNMLYVSTSTQEAALVNVYNLTGQLVMQGKTGGEELSTFNASALNNGIYVVNVILNEGVVSRKVVIRK